MPKKKPAQETATLVLNGDVYLDEFAVAVEQFQRLMAGLSAAVAGARPIEWKVEALDFGSAIVTIRGEVEDKPQDVPRVISAYDRVGLAASKGRRLPYSKYVRRPVSKLQSLLNGRITSFRMETENADSEIFSPHPRETEVNQADIAYGSVEGRIQSMSNRGALRFTMYDSHDDHAVSCYLRPGCEDVMRDAWGKMATVEGIVRRHPISGRVSTVRDVTEGGVIIHDEPSGDWREAIGCAPALAGSISPEEAIRRGRDG